MLAAPSGLWRLTFALEFRALGSLQFFLEHSLAIWLQLEIRLKGVDLGFSMALSVE